MKRCAAYRFRLREGFTFLELMISIAVIGLMTYVVASIWATVSLGRLRVAIDSEASAWHHNYAMGLLAGDFDRSGAAGSSFTQTFVLSSGISVQVTDVFSAPTAALPGALVIKSKATWSSAGVGQLSTSHLTVERGSPPTVL